MCSWQKTRLNLESLLTFCVLPVSLHGWEWSSVLWKKYKLLGPEAITLSDIWVLLESLFCCLEKVIPPVSRSPFFWKVGLAFPHQNTLNSCPVIVTSHCFQVLPDAVHLQADCGLGVLSYVYLVVCAGCKQYAAGNSRATVRSWFTGKFSCD